MVVGEKSRGEMHKSDHVMVLMLKSGLYFEDDIRYVQYFKQRNRCMVRNVL